MALGALAGGALLGWLLVALNPLGLVLGPLAWLIAVIVLARRGPSRRRERREVIDPFALSMPWRSFVKQAVQARRRFERATAGVEEGPLAERFGGIAHRLDTAVDEVWDIANRGQALTEARRRIDTEALRRRLDAARDQPDDGATADALAAQLASAERMDDTRARLERQLGLIQARTDEAMARASELTAGSGSEVSLGTVDTDLSGVVDELEALRQGLAELSGEPGGEARGEPRRQRGDERDVDHRTGDDDPGDARPGTA